MKNDRIKVLMVAGGYPPASCGIGDYTRYMCEAMSRAGADVSVLTSSFHGTKPAESPVRVLPLADGWKAASLKALTGIIRAQAPEIVHIQYPNVEYKKNIGFNLLPFAIKAAFRGVTVAATFHEPLAELTLLGKLRHLANFPFIDRFIFVEKENFETLPWYLKFFVRGRRTACIPIGSNIPAVRPDRAFAAGLKRKYGVKKGQKLVATFGFITKVKGYEAVFDILDPKKHVWMHIGELYEPEQYQVDFVNEARKRRFAIKFTGHLPDREVARHLSAADVCLFPFKHGVTPRHGTFLAALNQGTYTAAYFEGRPGYDRVHNVYNVTPGDADGMRKAVDFMPPEKHVAARVPQWNELARRTIKFYRETEVNG